MDSSKLVMPLLSQIDSTVSQRLKLVEGRFYTLGQREAGMWGGGGGGGGGGGVGGGREGEGRGREERWGEEMRERGGGEGGREGIK